MAVDKWNHLIEDFSGGLNERDGHKRLEDKESVPPTQNVVVSRRGVLQTRPGTSKFVEPPVEEGEPITGLYRGYLEQQVFWSLWGEDRYHTAAEVALELFHEVENVVLGRGTVEGSYADICAAAPLARELNAPILITPEEELPGETLRALYRLKPDTIWIVGETEAVSQEIEDQLADDPEEWQIERIGGEDRMETARFILDELAQMGSISNNCYIIGSTAPADAAIVSGVAASFTNPILYVDGELGEENENAITTHGFSGAIIVGGTARVPQSVENELIALLGDGQVIRVAGDNRYLTARNYAYWINNPAAHFVPADFEHVIFATGTDQHVVDAAVASPIAACTGAITMLTRKDNIPSYIEEHLEGFVEEGTKIFVVGGPEAIGQEPFEQIIEMAIAPPPELYFLATAGPYLKRWDGEEWITLSSSFTEGADMEFLNYKYAIYLVNGVDGYFRIEKDLCTDELWPRPVRPYMPTDEEIEHVGANAIPEDPKYLALHYDRIWLARVTDNKLRVFMSDIGQVAADMESPFKKFRPDYFPANNHLEAHCRFGDQITGLVIYQDRPYIFTKYGTWTVYGTAPEEYQLVKIMEEGAISHRSIQEFRGLLIFLSERGPVVFDGTNTIELYWRIPETLAQIDRDLWSRSAAVIYDNFYKLSIPIEENNDVTLDLDLYTDLQSPETHKGWIPHKGFHARVWLVDEDYNLVFGGNDGYVYQWDKTVDNDDGTSFQAIFTTKEYDIGAWLKILRFVLRAEAGDYDIIFRYRMERGPWITRRLNLRKDPFGTEGVITKIIGAKAMGTSTQMQIENATGKPFTVYFVGIEEAYLRRVRV